MSYGGWLNYSFRFFDWLHDQMVISSSVEVSRDFFHLVRFTSHGYGQDLEGPRWTPWHMLLMTLIGHSIGLGQMVEIQKGVWLLGEPSERTLGLTESRTSSSSTRPFWFRPTLPRLIQEVPLRLGSLSHSILGHVLRPNHIQILSCFSYIYELFLTHNNIYIYIIWEKKFKLIARK